MAGRTALTRQIQVRILGPVLLRPRPGAATPEERSRSADLVDRRWRLSDNRRVNDVGAPPGRPQVAGPAPRARIRRPTIPLSRSWSARSVEGREVLVRSQGVGPLVHRRGAHPSAPRRAGPVSAGSKRWPCSGFLNRPDAGSTPAQPTMRATTRRRSRSDRARARQVTRAHGITAAGEVLWRHAGPPRRNHGFDPRHLLSPFSVVGAVPGRRRRLVALM